MLRIETESEIILDINTAETLHYAFSCSHQVIDKLSELMSLVRKTSLPT